MFDKIFMIFWLEFISPAYAESCTLNSLPLRDTIPSVLSPCNRVKRSVRTCRKGKSTCADMSEDKLLISVRVVLLNIVCCSRSLLSCSLNVQQTGQAWLSVRRKFCSEFNKFNFNHAVFSANTQTLGYSLLGESVCYFSLHCQCRRPLTSGFMLG